MRNVQLAYHNGVSVRFRSHVLFAIRHDALPRAHAHNFPKGRKTACIRMQCRLVRTQALFQYRMHHACVLHGLSRKLHLRYRLKSFRGHISR